MRSAEGAGFVLGHLNVAGSSTRLPLPRLEDHLSSAGGDMRRGGTYYGISERRLSAASVRGGVKATGAGRDPTCESPSPSHAVQGSDDQNR